MSYKHKCAYDGKMVDLDEQMVEVFPCQNEVTINKIFCRDCFQSVPPAMRRAWGIAFPYDVPYDLAMSRSHEDQRAMVESFREAITQARLQGSLFPS